MCAFQEGDELYNHYQEQLRYFIVHVDENADNFRINSELFLEHCEDFIVPQRVTSLAMSYLLKKIKK